MSGPGSAFSFTFLLFMEVKANQANWQCSFQRMWQSGKEAWFKIATNRGGTSNWRTPSAKGRLEDTRTCIFLGKFDPLRQLSWLAEGGWYCEIMLDVRSFLAFRQWPSLAEGPSNASQNLAKWQSPPLKPPLFS